MALPKYNELYQPFLTVIKDGRIYTFQEIKEKVAEILGITDDELKELVPSGRQRVYDNRISWAKTYLKKAGLVSVPQRARFQITKEGQALLSSGRSITNQLLAEKYPSFAEFYRRPSEYTDHNSVELQNGGIDSNDPTETPQEIFAQVYKTINEQLADDLLTEIMNQSPSFFEHLVVELMSAMGYGKGFVTKASGDGGIDGIINEDKLGFNLIYIQAKRWDPDTTITRPEIQKFVGAMMGPPKVEKGLFITTAKFAQGAQKYANQQHVILVDGKRLTELMIEYDLGVTTQEIYRMKRIDSDYFSEIG